MKCKIIIDMDNQAFEDDVGELARILLGLARWVNAEGPRPKKILDFNGNAVGEMKFVG